MNPFASVWVPCFVSAAETRCKPALAETPLVVVAGAPPVTRVVDANAAARERGVRPAMTEAEARARCPGLVTRAFSEAHVAAARSALLEALSAVSPRVEDVAPGLVDVDARGLERLIGDAAALGERLVRQARAVGLGARVGIAADRMVARIAARLAERVTIIAPGRERASLSAVPVSVLDLADAVRAALAAWGVTTLGELGALPRAALGARLGAAGLRAQDLALGRDREPFRPWMPPPFYQEAQGLDWEIDSLAALGAVLAVVLDRLCARLRAADLFADVVHLHLELANGERDERAVALASPMREPALVLVLVRHSLEARPPQAPVTAVAVSARPVRAPGVQAGLWQPPAPVPRDLAAVLARLVALVGGDHVGSPRPSDTHRADAFTVEPFAPRPGLAAADDAPEAGLVLRRIRPPRPVGVDTDGGAHPARVVWDPAEGEHARHSRVVRAAGPWFTSGEWWDRGAWARAEWDVLLADGTVCRLAHDQLTDDWLLDGVYD